MRRRRKFHGVAKGDILYITCPLCGERAAGFGTHRGRLVLADGRDHVWDPYLHALTDLVPSNPHT